jgi:hypothetical protein
VTNTFAESVSPGGLSEVAADICTKSAVREADHIRRAAASLIVGFELSWRAFGRHDGRNKRARTAAGEPGCCVLARLAARRRGRGCGSRRRAAPSAAAARRGLRLARAPRPGPAAASGGQPVASPTYLLPRDPLGRSAERVGCRARRCPIVRTPLPSAHRGTDSACGLGAPLELKGGLSGRGPLRPGVLAPREVRCSSSPT